MRSDNKKFAFIVYEYCLFDVKVTLVSYQDDALITYTTFYVKYGYKGESG